jgi:hypothetical protein
MLVISPTGDDFDLKEFHHQVLTLGPVPLDALDYHVKYWIDHFTPNSALAMHSSLGLLLFCMFILTYF